MNIVVVTPPPVEPVTAAEAFFQLKLIVDVTDDVEDEPQYAEVMRAITTSREQCEQITRRAFVQQTLRLSRGPAVASERRGLQWYMNGGGVCLAEIELLRPPLISVASVKYYDETNVQKMIDPANYYAVTGLVSRLRFVQNFWVPSPYLREDAIQIEYVAGYLPVPADANANPPTEIDYRANVPASIKSAILLGVQLQIDKLTPAERDAVEKAQAALLSSFRVHSF